MGGLLRVFREHSGSYQNVGIVTIAAEGTSFAYAPDYMATADAAAISLALPLQAEPFSHRQTFSYFEGLLPEGDMRELLARSLRLEANSYPEILACLNNESSGALIFSSVDTSPINERSYTPFSSGMLEQYSAQPRRVALDTGMTSRLSLAGAQAKLGLYHEGTCPTDGWFLPKGSAPSTHIIKVCDGTFPHQVINEALCLLTARYCGFETAECFLIPMPNANPLLAVRRFDRVIAEDSPETDNHKTPRRLHQEDLCQAAGLPSHLKYEPTDGYYLNLAAGLISRSSQNPFGDKMMFFSRILFDFLIGNCDNHLKNHSFLWDADWRSRSLSPLYDITSTVLYPALSREMGVSLCASRRIDDTTAAEIISAAASMGIPGSLAWAQYTDLRNAFPHALKKSEQELVKQGFPDASTIAGLIAKEAASRLSLQLQTG